MAPFPRRSLRFIGIPDARDALAAYFHWVRTARYYRAQGLEPSPSNVAVNGDAEEKQQFISPPATHVGTQLHAADMAHDLMCVGAVFDAVEQPVGVGGVGYAQKLDLLG